MAASKTSVSIMFHDGLHDGIDSPSTIEELMKLQEDYSQFTGFWDVDGSYTQYNTQDIRIIRYFPVVQDAPTP